MAVKIVSVTAYLVKGFTNWKDSIRSMNAVLLVTWNLLQVSSLSLTFFLSPVSHGVVLSCQFEQDGCTVDYSVTLSPPFRKASVFVGEERG